MTMNKGHRSVPLFLARNSLRLEATPSSAATTSRRPQVCAAHAGVIVPAAASGSTDAAASAAAGTAATTGHAVATRASLGTAGAQPVETDRAGVIEVPGLAAEREAAGRPTLQPWSPVEALRARLRELGAPIYGTKQQLWHRLCDWERAEFGKRAQEDFLARRRAELQSAVDPVAPQLMPVPVPPSPEEVKQHRITHLPSARWCEQCVMARGQETPHARPAKDAEERLPVFAFDFCFIKTGGDTIPTEDELATNLVAVGADTWCIKAIPCPAKTASDYVVKGLTMYLQP